MLTIPRFAPHVTVTFVPPDAVVVTGSGSHRRIQHAYWSAVYPRINGTTSVDDIVAQCAAEHPTWDITDLYTFLFQLEKRGIVVEAKGAMTPLDVMAMALSAPGQYRMQDRALPTLRLHGVGDGDVHAVRNALMLEAVQLTDDVTQSALDVYVTDDYLQPALAKVNQHHRSLGTPWILVQTHGFEPMIGPMFTPGASACWDCLATRYAMNRDVTSFLQPHAPDAYPFPETVVVPGTASVLAGLLIQQLAIKTVGHRSVIDGTVLSYNTMLATTTQHTVVQRPQCPTCGTQAVIHAPVAIELQSSPRRQATDAGYRSMTAEQVFDRYRHLVSPISGVVTSLERITDPTDPIQHVYVSGQNFATSHGSIHQLRRSLRSTSSGKGTSDIQAKVSGLCEAVERYSGVFRGDEYRIQSTFRELGDAAIHPNDTLLLSEQQYRDRELWNQRQHKFSLVCEPFDIDARYEWSPVWSLTERRTKWLPTGHLYYSYPQVSNRLTFMPDSNGASTGATREEAILQGYFELAERDAVAMWWYPMTRHPRVDLASYDHPYVRAMEQRVHELGRELWVIDVTNDLGIPVFVAFSRDPKGLPENIVFAPGAHIDPTIALLRALTELNQMFPGIAPGPNGSGYAYDDPHCVEWWQSATAANQPYILADDAQPMSRREHYQVPQTSDLLEDIAIVRDIVESRGMEFLVHDQTRPDIQMPVVKVIVPGMRHFWTRFAPGRLYDVPLQLGRVRTSPAEDAMNPVALFI